MSDKRKNLKLSPELHRDLKVLAAKNGNTLEEQLKIMKKIFKGAPKNPFSHYRKSIFPLDETKKIISKELAHFFRGDKLKEESIIPSDEPSIDFLAEIVKNDNRKELREWFIDELDEAPEAITLREEWGIK